MLNICCISYKVCKNLKERENFEAWRNLGRVSGGEYLALALKDGQDLIQLPIIY